MKNLKQNYDEIADFDDVISYFDESYNDLTELTNKLDEMYWNIEREGVNGKIISSIEELVSSLDNGLKKVFKAEEILFLEMKDVMPEQSSVNALQSENELIIGFLNSLKALAADNENAKKEIDLLQAEMIAVADIIQRNIHKKGSIFLHEVTTMLPAEKLEEIFLKIKPVIALN